MVICFTHEAKELTIFYTILEFFKKRKLKGYDYKVSKELPFRGLHPRSMKIPPDPFPKGGTVSNFIVPPLHKLIPRFNRGRGKIPMPQFRITYLLAMTGSAFVNF